MRWLRAAAGGCAAISKRCAHRGEVSRRTAARRCHPIPPLVRLTPAVPARISLSHTITGDPRLRNLVETERSPLLAFNRSLTLALHLNVRCSFLVEHHCRNCVSFGKGASADVRSLFQPAARTSRAGAPRTLQPHNERTNNQNDIQDNSVSSSLLSLFTLYVLLYNHFLIITLILKYA